MPADPQLVRGWLAARSVARGLPAPIADHGGWRVETGLLAEMRRHVFAAPVPAIRHLGETIDAPHIVLKACATETEMRDLLPGRWQMLPAGTMMVCDTRSTESVPPPAGYTLQLDIDGAVSEARVTDEGGALAAQGHAAESDGVFVYDRIITEPAHQRLGLGRIIMNALGSARRSARSRQILVATAEGRALYLKLGWQDYSAFMSAAIPADARKIV